MEKGQLTQKSVTQGREGNDRWRGWAGREPNPSEVSALERRKLSCPTKTREGIVQLVHGQDEAGLRLPVLDTGSLIIQQAFIEHLLPTRYNSRNK